MCNKLLDSVTVAEHLAELYCKQCHGRKYGPKGVGFGIGAGALTMDTGERFGNKTVEMTAAFLLIVWSISNACLPQCPPVRTLQHVMHVRLRHTLLACPAMCNKMLDSTTVAEHGAELFCKTCHCRKHGPKGVGFGLGGGCLTTDKGERFGNYDSAMSNRPLTGEAWTAPVQPGHR